MNQQVQTQANMLGAGVPGGSATMIVPASSSITSDVQTLIAILQQQESAITGAINAVTNDRSDASRRAQADPNDTTAIAWIQSCDRQIADMSRQRGTIQTLVSSTQSFLSSLQQTLATKDQALMESANALQTASQQLSQCNDQITKYKSAMATVQSAPPPASSTMPLFLAGAVGILAGAGGLYAYSKIQHSKAK